ncbi:MAG: hypothetical protein JWM53_53, partial [bacterium]|nr:hypothetical protein [bacterium]
GKQMPNWHISPFGQSLVEPQAATGGKQI